MLANLTAKGIDITQAQAVLDQITAERSPLKAAFDSHDQAAVKNIDSQLTALYEQFRTTVQGYRQSAVTKIRENAGNMTRNATFRPTAFHRAVTPVVTGVTTS
jgi:hypothetical protein